MRFRGGLVFKAHRLWHDSTLGLRVIIKKKKVPNAGGAVRTREGSTPWGYRGTSLMYRGTSLITNAHPEGAEWGLEVYRSRANMAHIRQSRPDAGLGCQEKVIRTF